MFLQKKLLFLLLTLVLTLTAACNGSGGPGVAPDDTTEQTKKRENAECVTADACDTGLLCIANDTAGTTGTCKKEKACTAAQDCTKGEKTSCNEVQGIGKTLHICGKPPAPDKKKEGDTCTATDTCDTGLFCVTNSTSDTSGTCKKETACTAAQDCTEAGKNSCNDVPSLGTTLNLCGAPKQKDETCSANQICGTGLFCIATDATGTSGTCQEAKACTAAQDCTEAGKNSCNKVPGIGETLHLCGAPKQKDETCSANQICDTGLFCIANDASGTSGTCQEAKACTAATDCTETDKTSCNEVQGIGETLHLCGAPKQENETCSAKQLCDTNAGLLCIATNTTDTTGTCKKEKVCASNSDCTETDKTSCNEVPSIGGTTLHICGKPPQQKGDACSADEPCDISLFCIANNASGTSGTCQEAKACTSAATDCTEAGKNSCNEVQGIGGTTLNLCGAPKHENETCSAKQLCDTDLFCVTNGTSDTSGTCKKGTVCTAAGDCTAPGKNSCNEVPGIGGTTLNLCGDPKHENETCSAKQLCDTNAGLLCIANDITDTTGTCKKEKACTSHSECTEGKKTSCNEVPSIGGTTLHTCGVPPKKENEKCTPSDLCDIGLKCIGETATEGLCKKEISCTAETEVIYCNAKGYDKCVDRKLVADSSDVKVCDAGDYTTKVSQNDPCFDDDHCDTGLKCMKLPGNSAGRCESVTECTETNKETVCTEEGKKECVEKETINGNKINVCDGNACNETTLCPPGYACYPKDGEFKEGTCKKECKNDDQCSTEEACQGSYAGIGGTTSYMKVCLPNSTKISISGACNHETSPKQVCERGLVCAAALYPSSHQGNCTNRCTREGFNLNECKHPGARYCGPAVISVPGDPTNSHLSKELVCGPDRYVKAGKKDVTEECRETTEDDSCAGSLICIKKKAGDPSGICYGLPDWQTNECFLGETKLTAAKELVLPYSDHDMDYCQE